MKMEEGPESQKEKGNNESNHKESDDTSKELQNQTPSVLLATKVKSPKAKENRKNERNHKENNGISKGKKNKNPTMLPATKTKPLKQKKKDKGRQKSGGVVGSQMFARDEITNNIEASALISDLVKCYTCNCNLPQKELDNLNKTLYEKTVTLFLQILNNCVEKIFNKLLGTDIFKETFLSKKVVTKNVLCQTDVTYTDY